MHRFHGDLYCISLHQDTFLSFVLGLESLYSQTQVYECHMVFASSVEAKFVGRAVLLRLLLRQNLQLTAIYCFYHNLLKATNMAIWALSDVCAIRLNDGNVLTFADD